MRKFRNAFFYTIIMFFIYAYLLKTYLKKDGFSFNEVLNMFNIVFFCIYIIGLVFIILKKHNDKNSDNRLINRLEMKIPTLENYNCLKDSVKDIFIRSWNINVYNKKFFISDLEGNLLYKIKQKYGSIPTTYTIYDPYDNVVGTIIDKMLQITSGFKICINNKQSFEIKSTMDLMNRNYTFDNIPLEVQGDYMGFNYNIISKQNNGCLVAEINTKCIDGFKEFGNADIIVHDLQYSLEIICSVICLISGR